MAGRNGAGPRPRRSDDRRTLAHSAHRRKNALVDSRPEATWPEADLRRLLVGAASLLCAPGNDGCEPCAAEWECDGAPVAAARARRARLRAGGGLGPACWRGPA